MLQNSSNAGAGMSRSARRCCAVCVDTAQPGVLVEAFVERVAHAEPFRQRAEDVEVVARLRVRFDRALHREQIRVARRTADVVAFERGRSGQHDVGMPRGRRPPRFVHDDRVGFGERIAQAEEILVVMERVAAGPVDEVHVGIGQRARRRTRPCRRDRAACRRRARPGCSGRRRASAPACRRRACERLPHPSS